MAGMGLLNRSQEGCRLGEGWLPMGSTAQDMMATLLQVGVLQSPVPVGVKGRGISQVRLRL